jgi:GNAT superfamily N-acetyltransferase
MDTMASAQETKGLTFRPAFPADAELLSALAMRSKSHWGYPQEWLDHWRAELTILPSYIEQNSLVVANCQSGICGFFGLEFLDGSSARLQHLWVDPPFIGKGFGRQLFERACAMAKGSRCDSLELVADPNAERFYLRMGAIRVADERSEILGVSRVLPKMIYKLEHLVN